MTALLLIDIQVGLDELDYYGGSRNNPEAESRASQLLGYFRNRKWPVYHVQHASLNPDSPLHPTKPGHAIKKEVEPLPDEPLFVKNQNSAFVGTGLEDRLRSDGIDSLVVVGLTTEHCVSTSVRMGANLGFEIILISDATAAFAKKFGDAQFDAQTVHQVALANLEGEFAELLTAEGYLKEIERA